MKQLAELIETYRHQSAQVMDTMQAINRLISVEVSTSHSKRVEIIQHVVADHYGLPPDAMHSRVRTEQYARARHIAMFLARELTTFSLEDIAATFRPGLNHGTIIWGCRRVSADMETDKAFAATVAKLRVKCEHGIEAISMPLFAYAKSKKAAANTDIQ